MSKILVFGATGGVGAYFIDYLQERLNRDEYEIVAIGRKGEAFYKTHGIPFINLDIRNQDHFAKLPQKDVYAIIHLAGILPASSSKVDVYSQIDVNVVGTVRILEYARQIGVDRILYSQTWSVQGSYWGKSEVLSPSAPRKPIFTGDHAVYAITKGMVEDLLEHYLQEFGMKYYVFRMPNIYMYHPEKEYYVDGVKKYVGYRRMIDLASEGKDIELWGDPDAFKDVLYVKDLCQLFYKALLTDNSSGIYNAGTGVKTSLKEQIEGIIHVFSPKNGQSSIIYKPEKSNFVSFVMDISNAEADLGYKPEYMYYDYLQDYKTEQEKKRFDSLWTERN